METPGANGDKNTEVQHTAERSACTYRDLHDETKVTAFFSQYPEDAEEDSSQMEAIMGKPICARPSCLLNLRILASHVLNPGKPEAIADVDWAVPSDCEWRNATGVRSEP